jgi:hypothetical protein
MLISTWQELSRRAPAEQQFLLLQLITSRGVAARAFSGALILYRLHAEEWQDGLLGATLVRMTDAH